MPARARSLTCFPKTFFTDPLTNRSRPWYNLIMANTQAEPTRFNQYHGFRLVVKGPVDTEVLNAIAECDGDPITINRIFTRVYKASCVMRDIEPGTLDSNGVPIHHAIGAYIDEITRAGIDNDIRGLDEYLFTEFSIGVIYDR